MRLPNGYGSIFKLKGNLRKKWRVCLPATYEMVDNKLKKTQKVLGNFSTRQEAIRQLELYHGTKADGIEVIITLKDAFVKWFELKSKTVAKKWSENTKSIFKHFHKLHDREINSITLNDLQISFNEMKTGYATKFKSKTMFVNLFEYSVANNWCKSNIAKYIIIPKEEQKREAFHTNYTVEEIQNLWNNIESDSAKLQLILIYTGIRFGELFKITEWHLDEKYLITGSKTDAGKNRVIPIHNKILPFINILKTFNKYSDSKIRIIFNEASLNHTPHDTRYTFAWLMERAGVPLLITQKIMGHKSGNVTHDIYTNLNIEELLAEINKIDV